VTLSATLYIVTLGVNILETYYGNMINIIP